MIYITFERGGPKFSNTTAKAFALRTAVQQRQLRAKQLLYSTRFFFFFLLIKIESATAVQRAFSLRFNIQPPTRNSICRWNHQFIILKYRLTKLIPSFLINLCNWRNLGNDPLHAILYVAMRKVFFLSETSYYPRQYHSSTAPRCSSLQ
jgi:hypothetical protein